MEGGHRIVHKKDVLAFLCKLRQGCSDEFLKVIFGFQTRRAVSMAINNVLESLKLILIVRIYTPGTSAHSGILTEKLS